MRRRIRLTGRRQLPKSSVSAKIIEREDTKWVALAIEKQEPFKVFPVNAKVKLRLSENKCSETIDFGTVGNPETAERLNNSEFSAPSCQLRIVAAEEDQQGLLLGSTGTWTLRSPDSDRTHDDGILLFQTWDISPQIWKLDIREEEYPILYLDKSIVGSASWARSDPVFVGCVLPEVVRKIFGEIRERYADDGEVRWMQDWLNWAKEVTGHDWEVPSAEAENEEVSLWMDEIVEGFCRKHGVIDKLRSYVGGRE